MRKPAAPTVARNVPDRPGWQVRGRGLCCPEPGPRCCGPVGLRRLVVFSCL